MRRWVVFDLGETLVDETRNWGRWADHLAVPRLTFFAVMGAVIAERRPHTDAIDYVRPGFRMEEELAAKTAAGNGWVVEADDLYPDALPVLGQLRRRGYRLAVMANQPLQAAPFLATLPVDAVATSAEWELAKPDPRFFERICRTLGSPPADIAYVGDRVDNDVLPAKAAGMVAVHVRRGPWGVLHAQWPEAVDADARIDQLAELPEVLQHLGFLPTPAQPGRQQEQRMEQRVSLVTLGVADLARARAFYGRLGWQGQEVEQTVFYQAGGLAVVLWGRDALARDCGVPDAAADGFGGVVLAHNVRSQAEVDDVLQAAAHAGATVTRPAGPPFYGGYAGCFADPDGHVWEVAFNPGLPLAADGSLTVPDFGP